MSLFEFTFLKYLSYFTILVVIFRYIFNGPKTSASKDMSSKIIIITGSSAGIGKEAARDLLNKGAVVIFACRDKTKTLNVIKNITNPTTIKNAHFIELNLSSFKSVNSFVPEFSKKFDKLDILINNAGVFNEMLRKPEDNLENTIQTNHISHQALSGLLLKFLKKSDDPRIINVGSEAHTWVKDLDYNYYDEKTKSIVFDNEKYTMFNAYGISKAANIFLSEAIQNYSEEYLKENQIKSACVHPGAVYTEISRVDGKPFYIQFFMYLFGKPLMFLFFKDEVMGAQTTLHTCYIEKNELVNGGYYYNCKVQKKSANIRLNNLEKKIHQLTNYAITNSLLFKENTEDADFMKFNDYILTRIQL